MSSCTGSYRLGGSVLAEQTVLTFSSHPPSTGCSDVLPSTVCEGRGGEKRFAMNQRTQLQFNLGVAPNHTKLATSFGPSHPSPVTIHKPAAETIGISCTPIQDFKAVSPNKLALAMKLAKRNVNSVPDLRVYDVESEETDESFEEVELKQNHLRKDVRCQNVRGYAPSEAIGRELGELQLELDRSIERMHRSKGKGKRAAVRAVDRLNARVVGGVGGGRPAVGVVDRANTKSVGGGRPAVGVADRARAAGKAGARVVGTGGHALRMTDRPSARIAGWVGARGDVKVVNDRICWVDLDENQEREQQRREEQVTRNTRMMYDLSQQVKGLQKQTGKRKPQSTQSMIVQKLAAAQRAALRTLQGFSHYGRAVIPIPPELTFLIQQLGLLSSQLGAGVNTEMSDDLRQLMVKLDDNQVPKSLPTKPSAPLQPNQGDGLPRGNGQPNRGDGQPKGGDGQPSGGGGLPNEGDGKAWTAVKYGSGKRKKRQVGGVLFTSLRHQRRLGQDSTHFTNSTFNSVKRQQPPLPYTPCQDCSPQVQRRAVGHGTPRFCHLHLSPADFKSETRKKKKKVHPQYSPRYAKAQLPARSPKPARKKKKVSRSQKKSDENKDGDKEKDYIVDLVDRLCSEDEPEMTAAELSSAIASQANQLQELRRDISQKLAELKSGRDRGEAERSTQFSSTMPAMDAKLPLELEASDLNFSDPRLLSMLRRLEELEAEEDAIRQRWNTILYEDPLVTRPPVTCQEEPHEVVVTPRNLEQGASLPVLSSQSLSSIEQYRQRYTQHLNTTASMAMQGTTAGSAMQGTTAGSAMQGTTASMAMQGTTAGLATQRGVLDPWKIAESIADDLLGEALEGVASEVELLCDNCVEELYNYEFIRPP